jgi:hypothetical protein
MRVEARGGHADTSLWDAFLPEAHMLLRTTAEAIERSRAIVQRSVPSIESAKRALLRSRDAIERTLRRFEAQRTGGGAAA